MIDYDYFNLSNLAGIGNNNDSSTWLIIRIIEKNTELRLNITDCTNCHGY
jgi:hypothetical protein